MDEVERWKRGNGPFKGAKKWRSPPTESEIRTAFEEDPKTHPLRKERMDDEYRPEVRRERERERTVEEEREREWEKEARWEREESWRESPRDRRYVDKTKFDGPPPPNYICNRCGEKGMLSPSGFWSSVSSFVTSFTITVLWITSKNRRLI